MARPKSAKARKQRKYVRFAPLHIRRKLIAAHLSDELRKQYGARALPIRKGDEVTVMRGKFRKKSGKVTRINTGKYRVYVEGAVIKRTDGTERQAGLHASNLLVTKLALDDKRRAASLEKHKPAAKKVK
ncbi:MAG: 50S ribosomal protein L24 [Candidatus Aenigmarchaeota archaeon]|nr:50S ribosomal protein L24 [Candidatus Aenigmarchaeota archaeon]